MATGSYTDFALFLPDGKLSQLPASSKNNSSLAALGFFILRLAGKIMNKIIEFNH
jgi:hypothetical protein